MSEPMVVTTTPTEGAPTVVGIRGEIDIYSAPQLREHFLALIDQGHHQLVVDLDGVTFIDSTGLSVLVGVLKRIRVADGVLRLVCTHERIIRLFRITALPRDFPMHDTVAEAIAACAVRRDPS